MSNVTKLVFGMYVPLGPNPSVKFRQGAMQGYQFAQFARVRDRRTIGTKKLSPKETKMVVDKCQSTLVIIGTTVRLTLTNSTLEEGEAFIRGFYHGIKCFQKYDKHPERRPKAATTALAIYQTLLQHQAEINALRSIPQVHEWLCSKLQKSIVGDVSRTKKLCHRIGLRFLQRGPPQ